MSSLDDIVANGLERIDVAVETVIWNHSSPYEFFAFIVNDNKVRWYGVYTPEPRIKK